MPKISEHSHQVSFFQWLKFQHPAVDCVTFAVPNGGQRNIVVAKKLKAEGVKAGIPDICCALPVGGYHALFIEMKAEGGRVSKEQAERITELKKNGYAVCVCYGFTEARDCMERYLSGEV